MSVSKTKITPFLAMAALAGMATAGPALAHSMRDCTSAPQSAWKSMADMQKVAEAQGIEVRKIEIEGSCYEIKGLDKDGMRVELYLDPATGEVLRRKVR